MKLNFKITSVMASIMAITGSACQTTAQAQPSLAVLKNSDETSMQALKSALAKAMKTSKVELGASDPTNSSTISVLPKSLRGLYGNDQANFALPTQFDLMMNGESCYLVKRGSDTKIPLQGVKCRPLSN